MGKIIKFRLIMLLFVGMSLFPIVSSSQEIKVKRTDVDSTRNTFITATYKFGIDVYVDKISNCNGVSFNLTYNNSKYVRFSGYLIKDFSNVFVSYNDLPGGMGRVVVGASSDNKPGEQAIDNPVVVRLEFVVLQSSPDFSITNEYIEFDFNEPDAVVLLDGNAEKIQLEDKKIKYEIHSYVKVWPGDADNNGIVDGHDYTEVNLHNGTGALTKNFRSFKRKNPSTIWIGQRVLKWDSARVTYADCDGNGDITMADMHVIKYNLYETHALTFSSIESTDDEIAIPEIEITKDDLLVPIRINSDKDFISINGTINLDDKDSRIKGIVKGDLFDNNIRIIQNVQNDNYMNFFITTLKETGESERNGILAYAVIENPNVNSQKNISVSNLTAQNNYGYLFTPYVATDIKDNKTEDRIFVDINKQLHIGLPNTINSADITIYSMTGQKIISNNVFNNSTLNLSDFHNGLYIAIITSGNIKIMQKFIID